MPASDEPDAPRQRIERVRGSRRAKLTPVEGTITDFTDTDEAPDAAPPANGRGAASGASGPNDEQLRRDVPPHY